VLDEESQGRLNFLFRFSELGTDSFPKDEPVPRANVLPFISRADTSRGFVVISEAKGQASTEGFCRASARQRWSVDLATPRHSAPCRTETVFALAESLLNPGVLRGGVVSRGFRHRESVGRLAVLRCVAATTPKHLDAAHAPFKLQRQRTACAAALPKIEYGITLAATTPPSGPSIGFASAVRFLVDHPRDTAQSMPCLQRPTLALSHQNRWGCLVRAGPVSTSEQNPWQGKFAFCLLIGFKSSPSRASVGL
jgi:hypothetical protein